MVVMLSPRIAALLRDPAPEDAAAALWAEVTATGTPLVEPYDDRRKLVTFVWRGQAESIRAWRTIDVPLSRVPGTDLWCGSDVFPADLRTIYCLVHGDTRRMPHSRTETGPALLDPANPHTFHLPADPADPTDSEAWGSVLDLRPAPASPGAGKPAGQLHQGAFASAALGYDVRASAYLPPGTDPARLPVIVFFDGYLGQSMMRVPKVLDDLIAAGRIAPMAALFVRGPDLFRAVIAHSGSFWWPSPDEGQPGRLIRDAARLARPGMRFYLDVGLLETSDGPGGAPSQLAACREMRDALLARGCQVTYQEFQGGHDYLNWRHNFPDALLATRTGPGRAG
jgi:enterochelin esterase-like enzyme